MTHRRYSQRERITTVVAAEATSVTAAAEATGIPRTTIQYWRNDPEFVAIRQNAREEIAEEATVGARIALNALITAIRSGQVESRDLVMATGMLIDKAQLLSGGATARTEARDITGTLSDAELDATIREAVALTSRGAASASDAAEG